MDTQGDVFEPPSGGHFSNLKKHVLEASVSKVWSEAVREWRVVGVREDKGCGGECICGQQRIKYLFRIRNLLNGNELYPIGSNCVTRFEVDELSDDVALFTKLCKLMYTVDRHGWNAWTPIDFGSGLYSRKLLDFMFKTGAFVPNKYNNGCPYNDYCFMTSMFNKKSRMTDKQKEKVRAVIGQHVYPWLRKHYDEYLSGSPMSFEAFEPDCCGWPRCMDVLSEYNVT